MTEFLRIALPAYFLVYFGVAFVLKSILIARRIGKSPLVLPQDGSAYGLIGLYFKLSIFATFIYVVVYALFPAWHDEFLPIVFLNNSSSLKAIGLAALFISLVWTVIAQEQMKNSWRIGIDRDHKTLLVTRGLFSVSRNPIFLGMILSLLGLFLVTPNALTALLMILGYVLIQIQIRLEEEFLSKMHSEDYLSYRQKVRRLI